MQQPACVIRNQHGITRVPDSRCKGHTATLIPCC